MIDIAILGNGVVGGGLSALSLEVPEQIAKAAGDRINVKYILDKRDFPDSPFRDRVVRDIRVILNDPDVKIVAEMMGGSHPAYDFSLAALKAGKHVVTSNKEVVATFGTELLRTAEENGVSYRFEASVGGGIPIIRALNVCLAAEEIEAIYGILNGTTNYILTRMFADGVSFEAALAEAQSLGYAEADPSADVNGIDTCRKTCILSALAFGRRIAPENIPTFTMRTVSSADVAAAEKLGCSVKFVGATEKLADGKILSYVAPCFIKASSPLAGIGDVFNGVLVRGRAFGELMFYGRGAGRYPTAASVLADIVNVIRSTELDSSRTWTDASDAERADFSEHVTPRYLRYRGDCEVTGELLRRADGVTEMVTPPISEADAAALAARIEAAGAEVESMIRFL